MKTTKTMDSRQLKGDALDWALSKALCPEFMANAINPHSGLSFWSEAWLGNLPANRALIASQLQEHLTIAVFAWRPMGNEDKCPEGEGWQASHREDPLPGQWTYVTAPEPTTAIFRLVVAIKLGDKVEIPEMLIDWDQFKKAGSNGDDCRAGGMEQTNNGSAV